MIWFFLMGFIAGVGCVILYGKHVSEKLEAELDKTIKKAQEKKKEVKDNDERTAEDQGSVD